MPTPNDFSRVSFTPQEQSYTATDREQRSGEFDPRLGGTLPAPAQGDYPRTFDRGFGESYTPSTDIAPYPGTNMVPSPTPSKQFSSDVDGNPRALLESTRSAVNAHADMNAIYGLTQPVATLGSHPWLRDSLADPSVKEPGNAMPVEDLDIPQHRTAR